jgi:glycosyltransferase involved in cell wall biosynthesis
VADVPQVTLLAPGGKGGVAAAVEAVLPELGPSVRWVRTGRRPDERLGLRAALRDLGSATGAVVHLHPSLRSRSVARDAALHTRARAAGARTVVSLHGWSRSLAGLVDREPALRALLTRTLLGADVVTALTADHVAALERWGVPAVRAANAWDRRVVATERLDGPRTVLFLGRLVPGKHPEVVIEALEGLPADVRVVLAGVGPLEAELRERAARWGARVEMPGWLDADGRREALAHASVLVLPSDDEAAPVAVLEALASGVPVVGTAVGAVPELVGDAGRIVREVSGVAVAEAIRALLDDASLPARARVRAAPYAPELVAASWRGWYTTASAAR